LNGAVSKTVAGLTVRRGFESLPLRFRVALGFDDRSASRADSRGEVSPSVSRLRFAVLVLASPRMATRLVFRGSRHSQREERRRFAHQWVIRREFLRSSHRQRRGGTVEDRCVQPARLERRPPQQRRGVPVSLEKPRRCALGDRALTRCDPRGTQAFRHQHRGIVEIDHFDVVGQLELADRERKPSPDEHRGAERSRPAVRSQRLGDDRERLNGAVQAAVQIRVVMPPGALELAREPERSPRRVVCRIGIERQRAAEDQANPPARSLAIASSNSRARPSRMRSIGRRS
jgi:hypothetical protein